ncbi:MAG: hypothetical protein QHH25_08440 [Candidatus Acetothermia bacterium]|jgi:hypothetical protein|nr:hypothetical protein [Candidatus Acetothermia bacterium]
MSPDQHPYDTRDELEPGRRPPEEFAIGLEEQRLFRLDSDLSRSIELDLGMRGMASPVDPGEVGEDLPPREVADHDDIEESVVRLGLAHLPRSRGIPSFRAGSGTTGSG